MSNLSYQALRFPDVSSLTPEELSEAEKNWVHFQPYLVSKGYQLRPRYRPGWVPSWKLSGANPYDCEDSIDSLPTRVLDAVRIKDDLRVVIKMIIPYDDDEEGEEERNILRYLSSEKCVDDPTNHAVRCLDSFSIPGVERGSFCIMPWLTAYHVHRFNNLEEIHELLVQLFEGLEFLHRNNIVHCDIAPSNIMMDVGRLHNGPFNPFIQNFASCRKYMAPLKLRRSNKSVRYYYIDFGYAKWFRYVQRNRMIKGTRARERAPEQVEGQLYDPFMVDVYQLGALIRRDLIPSYPSLRFLLPLTQSMTHHDPAKRVSLETANRLMNTHFIGMPSWRMRWPILSRNASWWELFELTVSGTMAEISFFLRQIVRLLFGNYIAALK